MHVRCPHCRNAIEIVGEQELADVVCPSCGSSFNLVPATDSYVPAVQTIAHFQLLGTLGAGGFGTVYKAKDTQLDRLVAIKIPRRDQVEPSQLEMFLREARAAAQLKHPGIVAVHEVGRENGALYIVSDFIEGVTLADRLTGGPVEAREAAELLAAVADALHHAHERGVIHRDLKPSNIMLEHAGGPKLLDFGLAKREAGEITMTVDGRVLGTAAYMSPELARGEAHHVDRRSDVYSLGVILFELLTGERPFRGNRAMLLHQVIHEQPPSPRKLSSRLPRDLETICLRCLHKEPRRRYATAADVAAELRRWLGGRPILARPVSRSERAWSWARRNPLVAGLAAAVASSLLAGVIGSSYFAVREHARATGEKAQRERADGQTLRAKTATALATSEAQRAKLESKRAYRNYYLAQMNLAQRDWEAADMTSLFKRLERTTPAHTGGEDLRGFEWHYLDRQSHRELLTIQGPRNAEVWDVAFDPTGKHIAFATRNHIRVHEAASGAEVLSIDSFHGAICVEYHPDGSLLASGGVDGRVILWSAATGEGIRMLKGHAQAVNALAFNRDGTLLASASFDKTVKISDPATGEDIHTFAGHSGPVESVAFHPDGKRLASCAQDNRVLLWDPVKGIEHTFPGHRFGASAVAFSPDGSRLATAGEDPSIRIWHLAENTEMMSIRGHSKRVQSIAFDPSDPAGQTLASASWDKTVKVWKLNGPGLETECFRGHLYTVRAVAFSLDGKQLASGSWDRSVRIWNPREQALSRVRFEGAQPLHALVHPIEETVAVSEGHSVRLSSATTGKSLRTFDGHSGFVNALAFNPRGSLLATASEDRGVKLWNYSDGTMIRTLAGHALAVLCVAFSPDGRRLASGSNDCRGAIWDVAGDAPPIWLDGHTGQVQVVAFTRDGKTLLTGSQDGTLRAWDSSTGKERFHVRGFDDLVGCLELSSDGNWFIAGSVDGAVRAWRVRDGHELFMLKGHQAGLMSVAFGTGGSRIVTASGDRRLKVWDAASGEELLTMHPPDTVSSVLSAAFVRGRIRFLGNEEGKLTLGFFDGTPR